MTVVTGGAPPSPTLLDRMAELNLHAIHAYGLTETYRPSAACTWHAEWDSEPKEERARLLARQGVGHLTVGEVKVVDGELAPVPADAPVMGEVVVRGNTVMKGYYRDPEATARAFAGGGFHTGDLAVLHPDGYMELRDRAKDVIISGGENISTIEVEQVVVAHPAVLECAVVAIPDEKWGERPKAFVTLKPGAARRRARSSTSAGAGSRTSSVRRRSSSASCRRPRRGRSRNTFSASASGRDAAGGELRTSLSSTLSAVSVSEAQLEHVDIASQEIYEVGVPHEGFRLLREHDPVHWHPWDWQGGGFWALTKHADVVTCRRTRRSSRPPMATSTCGISSQMRSRLAAP